MFTTTDVPARPTMLKPANKAADPRATRRTVVITVTAAGYSMRSKA